MTYSWQYILKKNFQLSMLFLTWFVVGVYGGPAIFLLLPLTLLLLKLKNKYFEIFLGFFFILILSDNLIEEFTFPIRVWGPLVWAKSIKNIYIVMLAAFFYMDRHKFKPFNRIFVKFIPFFFVAIIALMYSQTIATSAQKTLSYILLFITVPNYVTLIYREKGALFFKELVYFVVTIIAGGYLLLIFDYEYAFSHGDRLRGVFGNPNGLGVFLILTFALFLIVHKHYDKLFSKWEVRLIYAIFLFAAIKCGSRNAILCIAMFVGFSRFFKMSPFIGFIVFVAAAMLAEIITNNFIEIIIFLGLEEFFRLETLERGSGRYIAWAFAWENIQHQFFLGRGIAYDEHLMRSNYFFLSRLGHQGGVHNTYLILWLNTGLIGLLAYFRSFFLLFLKGAKNSRYAIPAMIVIMFSVMFEPWLAASLNPFTILFLIIITLLSEEEFIPAVVEEEEEEETTAPKLRYETA